MKTRRRHPRWLAPRRSHPLLLPSIIVLLFLAGNTQAQTSAFTFQGRLNDNAAPANGSYDIELKLFDTANVGSGTQIGGTIIKPAVQVVNGVFTVQLDFSAAAFPGADRFLEVAVKPAGSGSPLAVLSPRQPITSTPYAVRSTNATAADTATNASNATNSTNATQLGGLPANQYVLTSDARLTDARPPTPGSSNYIQNTTQTQPGNFNVAGGGTVGGNLTVSGAGSGVVFPDATKQTTAAVTGLGAPNTLALWKDVLPSSREIMTSNIHQNSSGNVGIGGGSRHRFNIRGGPSWTSNLWSGAIGLDNGGAIAWDKNAAGQSFGIGQSTGGLYFFRTTSVLGSPTFPANYDVQITDDGSLIAHGRVGIGTSTPGYALDVSPSSPAQYAMRVRNTASDGAAAVFVVGPDSAQRGAAIGHPSVAALFTGGSTFITGDSTPLPSYFGKGIVTGFAGTSGYISAFDYGAFAPQTLLLNNSGGRVGIGTSTPDQALTVNGNASKPGGGSWATFSDERLKTINGRFKPGLEAVMQLEPLRYEYKRDNALEIKSEGEHVGFGAQAVERVIPEAVIKDDRGYLLINNDAIMWTMLNGMQEQQKQIEQLKAEVKRLQVKARRQRK